MPQKSFLPIWITFKIWLLAVFINTFLGTLYLSKFFEAGSLVMLISYGLIFSAIFSLPVILIILIIINRCVQRKISGKRIFQIVLAAGIILTIGVFILFIYLMSDFSTEAYILFSIALISAMISVMHQYKSIKRLGIEFRLIGVFDFELENLTIKNNNVRHEN